MAIKPQPYPVDNDINSCSWDSEVQRVRHSGEKFEVTVSGE